MQGTIAPVCRRSGGNIQDSFFPFADVTDDASSRSVAPTSTQGGADITEGPPPVPVRLSDLMAGPVITPPEVLQPMMSASMARPVNSPPESPQSYSLLEQDAADALELLNLSPLTNFPQVICEDDLPIHVAMMDASLDGTDQLVMDIPGTPCSMKF